MKPPIEKSKEVWATNLRVLATISVILLHVSASPLYDFGITEMRTWNILNLYNSAVRFCVPVFVMLTGALLLKENSPLDVYLRKRTLRIVFPFLFWSIIYIGLKLFLKYESGQFSITGAVKTAGYSLLEGSAYHLWYIYMIIGLYLFIPVIRPWVQNASSRDLRFFLGIWLCTILFQVPGLSKYRPHIDLTYFTGFLGYLVLGYYLSTQQFSYKKVRLPAVIMIVGGIVLTFAGTYLGSHYTNSLYQYFYGYFAPNVLITAAGLFIFMKARPKPASVSTGPVQNLAFAIDRHSYGIYLSHVLILFLLDRAGINCFYPNVVIGVPLTTALCVLLSWLTSFLINKLPLGRHISG